MVKRIFVEKKKGFDVEAQGMLADIRQNLNIGQLENVRVINRYDVDGIDDDTYEMARYTVFAEPAIDVAYDEKMPEDTSSAVFFAVEYLPGQYDQRADSAAQCIKLMKPDADATVRFAKVIVLEGDLTEEQVMAIRDYCVNPVDSQQASLEKPASLEMVTTDPADVAIAEGFRDKSEEELEQYRKDMGFAMSHADIMHIQNYYKNDEHRDPTITELKVIDTYWSDHCRHTTFMTELTNISFEDSPYGHLVKAAFDDYMKMRADVYGDRDKDVCLMDMACIGAKYLKKAGKADDVDESEEVNACSIKVKAKIDGKEEDWLVMFKNETHNHPTEIEPFGGAATCLGGAIRDPLSGRVYVYQAMRVTGAADPRKSVSETIHGKLPQKKLTREAAAGYSSYGNQIGLAAGQIDEVYDDDYVAKRMEVGAVVGAAPADHVIRKVPEPGDVIILVGGRTGRDGCGGATGSSKEHTEDSILECGAEVQKGNPPVERNIQRLFRRKEVAVLIKRCNDFGAGGVSVAIGELADGLDIDLDKVPKKYEGLDGTELAISESQERMAVVVAADKEDEFRKYADEENLESTTVAVVTDTNRVKMTWRGKTILDLSRDFLNTNGAKQTAKATVNTQIGYEQLAEEGSTDNMSILSDALSDLNCCSKKGLIERFDSTIGAATVLMPLGGKHQLTPAAGMAAKLPGAGAETATIMAYGYDPQMAKKSPYHGAFYAVIDSVTKIVAMGGDRKKIFLSFQEYFEKLGENDESWGKPLAALLGALEVQRQLEIPSIGGKDSMSGTFMDINVPPALLSFGITTEDADNIISTELKEGSSSLVIIDIPRDENGILDMEAYKASMDKVHQLILEGKVLAADPVGKGGAFMTLVKMALGNKVGIEVRGLTMRELSQVRYGDMILQIPSRYLPTTGATYPDAKKLFGDIPARTIGKTTIDGRIKIIADFQPFDEAIDDVINVWSYPLEGVFPTRTADFAFEEDRTEVKKVSFTERNTARPAIKVARPKVLIPVFPGTNCEVDTARAFEKAGAEADIHIIRNLSTQALEDSINEMARKIKESQMIMIPGGFSGGDEPDGSAKFITAVFRNPKISEAVTDLLDNRDGLMLGICNGFQALIKLGLVPYGKITDMKADSPTLTYNKIGRHASCLVQTRIASVKSPWLAGTNVDDVYTLPVSHGEGRFIASEEMLARLEANGQIATQYVDFRGEPSMDIKYNPNGSDWAIEAITSPDGRVLGKMGHSERIGKNVYKNVPGEKDQKIFESGVAYFK